MLLFPILTFLGSWLLYCCRVKSFSVATIYAVLTFSSLVFLSTQLFSLFNIFQYSSLLLFWGSCLLVVAILFRNNKISLKEVIADFIKGIVKENLVRLSAIIFLLSYMFIAASFFPPNNWDSMTYHMARIPHWIANKNVWVYATNDYRQVHMPPFMEYCIAHVAILMRGDRFAFLVEYLFLLGSLSILYQISRTIGLSSGSALMVVLIALFLPEALLQSESTQSTITASFFVLTVLWFVVRNIRERLSYLEYFCMSLAFALALFTKTTAYVFLAPVMVFWGGEMLLKIVKGEEKFTKILWASAIVMGLFLIVNGLFFVQNFTMSGSILGTTPELSVGYANQVFGLCPTISNMLRNVALHYGIFGLNNFAQHFVELLHSWLHFSVSHVDTTWSGMTFELKPFGIQEDTGANVLHLSFLLFGSLVFLFKRDKMPNYVKGIYILAVLQFVLFCAYLRWQPWHTRLHTTIFLILSIPMAYLFEALVKNKLLQNICLGALFVYAVVIVTINPSKPIVNLRKYSKIKKHSFEVPKDWEGRYFMNRMPICADYKKVKSVIDSCGFKKIGLFLQGNDYEYPLFFDIYSRNGLEPVALNTYVNPSKIYFKPKPVDCVVSHSKQNVLKYRGEYFLKTTQGEEINLYVKK